MFWFLVKVAVVVVVQMALMPKPRSSKMKPADESEFDIPTAEEGREIPVLFGTRRLDSPNVVWWGDLKSVAIKETVRSGFSKKKVTVGYKYYVGMHMILSNGPIDSIFEIWVGDKMAWSTAVAGTAQAVINQPNLFGGDKREGGVSGIVDIEYGNGSQAPNAYLVSKLGSDVPAFRNLTGVVLNQVYIGTSAYLKPWSFRACRRSKLYDGSTQWYPAKANIGDYDLNPAHIIRECLTSTTFGKGVPTSDIDSTSFEYAADLLYAEGLGLSFEWGSNTAVDEFIQTVCQHIDGLLYKDMLTGKYFLKLARSDYNIVDLDTYDESDIDTVEDFSRPSIGDVPNQVVVHYYDLDNNKPACITIHDIAMISKQGTVIESAFQYNGITSAAVANKVAARELRSATAMLATMTIRGNRSMSALTPNDVFLLKWDLLGITALPVRVLSVDYGELENGIVTLRVSEDVFSVESAVYADPDGGSWTDPVNDPAVSPYQAIMELPYHTVVRDILGQDAADALAATAGFISVAASKPSSDALDYELLVRDGPTLDFYSEGRSAFTPNATLTSQLNRAASQATIALSNVEDLDAVEENTYAQIENELVLVVSVDTANNQITIERGLLDTIPAQHAAGSRIWFLESSQFLVGTEYADGDTPGVKVLPRTGTGQLAEGSASVTTAAALDSRINRPYLPGNLKINGTAYPASFSGQPELTWNHRDRTSQLDEYVLQTDATDYGPEAGTTYTLKIYKQDLTTLVRTETGLSGTSYTYLEADERSDCGLGPTDPLNTQLRFVLTAVRGGVESLQSYDVTIARA